MICLATFFNDAKNEWGADRYCTGSSKTKFVLGDLFSPPKATGGPRSWLCSQEPSLEPHAEHQLHLRSKISIILPEYLNNQGVRQIKALKCETT